MLLDPRRRYERDRTWCFWDVVEHPFADLVSHEWSRWRVRRDRAWIERSAPGLRYQHLPADAFYERVLARLRATEGVELRLGVRAGEVCEGAADVTVETESGALRAAMVFDSRPPPRRAVASPGREVAFLQHFEGWEIEADRPVFDPGLATLMDFAGSQEHGIHFFYVLPLSERTALVEATWFGTHVPGADVYRAYLERYIRGELGLSRWRVLRRERGALPMSSEPMPGRVGERIYRIGLGGGMAKPSTGYAFQAIQTYSAEMARRMAGEALPEPPEPRSWWSRFQDRVFLSYLARHPGHGPATLVRLFEKGDPLALARFLSDRASPLEAVDIMRLLPTGPVTLEVFRSPRIWLRR